MLMNSWKWTITVVTGSTSSSNGSSTYQRVLINLQCTPSDVLLSQQDLYPQLTTSGPHLYLSEVVITLLCVRLDSSDSPTKKMQNRTEKSGAQLPLFVPASSSQQHLFRRSTTYLAKIAVVLQDAPSKMLTFTQLMNKLAPLICEDRKSVENNIRVCLSANKCFVKIPVVPDSLDSKRNYWKLDLSQITAKMVRRHFKGILQLFPELASKVETENTSRPSERNSALHPPQPAACRAVQIRCEVKFSSPFSIESLLKRDSPSARASRASPLSDVPVRAEQQPRSTRGGVGTKRSFSWDSEEPLYLQASAGSSPTCSPGGSIHHGLTANGAENPIKGMHVCTEASFPIYTRVSAAPYFTSPHSSYITYSVPTFTHDALRFCL